VKAEVENLRDKFQAKDDDSIVQLYCDIPVARVFGIIVPPSYVATLIDAKAVVV
jgi:hypothetical protein